MSHDDHLPGYTVRRPVGTSGLLTAAGAGVAVGIVAFYLVRVMMERTPLLSPADRVRRERVLAEVDDGRDDAGWASEDIAIGGEPDEVEGEFADDFGIAEKIREQRELQRLQDDQQERRDRLRRARGQR